MKLEFIPKVITLLAGAIVCIITIVNDMDTTYSLAILLATLIGFYIIGQIAKLIIKKVIGGNMYVKRNDGKERTVAIPEEKKQEQEKKESEDTAEKEGSENNE